MPFKKLGKGKYQSPSGKTMNAAQVAMYYASKGLKDLPDRVKAGAK